MLSPPIPRFWRLRLPLMRYVKAETLALHHPSHGNRRTIALPAAGGQHLPRKATAFTFALDRASKNIIAWGN
jgi:hypothetical protein